MNRYVEIAEYFSQSNLETGERFFQEFNRKCQQLVSFGIKHLSCLGDVKPVTPSLQPKEREAFRAVLNNDRQTPSRKRVE